MFWNDCFKRKTVIENPVKLTANEARRLAEENKDYYSKIEQSDFEFTLDQCYQTIKDAAYRGDTECTIWFRCRVREKFYNKMKNVLSQDGYTVSELQIAKRPYYIDDSFFLVSW